MGVISEDCFRAVWRDGGDMKSMAKKEKVKKDTEDGNERYFDISTDLWIFIKFLVRAKLKTICQQDSTSGK